MTLHSNEAAYSQDMSPDSPEQSKSQAKIAKVNRINCIALVVFLAAAVATLALVGALAFPVEEFEESPPSYSATACDACGLLNRTKTEYIPGCDGPEPCCPTTLFPTSPVLSACPHIPSCCCPNSVKRRSQLYNLKCRTTSNECKCAYVNTAGDNFNLEKLAKALVIGGVAGVVLVVSYIWCFIWQCYVGKMKREIQGPLGNQPMA
ncbi:hypothetical protein Ae201684P_004911 [Aphanomyces euteiches]|uniref:Uncharacterized protein n=1 Tax=Aphanomyces euteiches TaxID=100861 RepID=A0A6G0W9R9_9STRA|nr:hypothetical protein Ae201684_017569 [Aphanomyces euteiches]KAH9069222.1 hypothetical protein Ae201684P_004911 [Aphanomyces euteiches]KAH9135357.1 hypothetical protein AeRB84_019204 [Aphanomyces euteiches]